MTIFKSIIEIKKSLLSKINQHSEGEQLIARVQVESHDDGYDVVALLLDSTGSILIDESHLYNIEDESYAEKQAKTLMNNIVKWTRDENVAVEQEVKEVCY